MYFPCQGWPWALDAGRAASYHTDRTRTRLGRASQHQPEGLARPVRGVWPHPRLCWGAAAGAHDGSPFGAPATARAGHRVSPQSRGEAGPVWGVGRRCSTCSPHTRRPYSPIGWQDSQAQDQLRSPWAVGILSVTPHAEAGHPRTPRPVTPARRGQSLLHAECARRGGHKGAPHAPRHSQQGQEPHRLVP